MSGMWGKHISISIFGESHGTGIGIVLSGLPGGIKIDLEYIKREMKRRAPGQNKISTPRKEGDEFEILSGYFNERTTGSPLCAVIYNTNKISKDYDALKYLMRPGHGDYTGYIKYSGFNDHRGGGHFSGRITAPLVFAGALCKQILEKKEIFIGSHVLSIGHIKENHFDEIKIQGKDLQNLSSKEFPVIEDKVGEEMKKEILKVKEEFDSIGGIIETAIINMDVGIGDPFFDSIESKLSHIVFSIPGVKGIEFGAGFEISKMKGSKANDEFYIENEKIKTYSNNHGGILGGISSGMPIIFRTAFKPTSSIGKGQKTIDINNNENTTLNIQGRHDPCIVPRALPVVDAVAAIAILDMIIEKDGTKWMI